MNLLIYTKQLIKSFVFHKRSSFYLKHLIIYVLIFQVQEYYSFLNLRNCTFTNKLISIIDSLSLA